jgi:Zn finger protein HypA/HybF involved in hydrogenase expression
MKRPSTFAPGRLGSLVRAPATLGSVTRAEIIRIIVWCKDCRHQAEPNPAEQARRYGAETTIPDWAARLRCSKCGSRNVDFVLTGARP